MDKELVILAAEGVQKAYDKRNHTDLGQAEFMLDIVLYQGKPLQRLSMPGSNEFWDWLLNIDMRWKDGVKRCTYYAVEAVYRAVALKIDPNIPLMVAGHSKAGPDALRWMAKIGADYCVSFCPPPAFKKKTKPTLDNTVIVIDPDDVVHGLGFITFDQPDLGKGSELITLPDDHKLFYIKDHVIDNILDALREKYPNAKT